VDPSKQNRVHQKISDSFYYAMTNPHYRYLSFERSRGDDYQVKFRSVFFWSDWIIFASWITINPVASSSTPRPADASSFTFPVRLWKIPVQSYQPIQNFLPKHCFEENTLNIPVPSLKITNLIFPLERLLKASPEVLLLDQQSLLSLLMNTFCIKYYFFIKLKLNI